MIQLVAPFLVLAAVLILFMVLENHFRKSEVAALREATLQMVLYKKTQRELAEEALYWVTKIIGAKAILIGYRGEVVATKGMSLNEAERLKKAGGIRAKVENILVVASGSWIFSKKEKGRTLKEFTTVLMGAMERVRLNEDNRRIAERFQNIFDGAPIGTGILDTQGRFTQVNASLLALLRVSQKEVVGKSIEEFFALTNRVQILKAMQSLIEGKSTRIEVDDLEFFDKTGGSKVVQATIASVKMPEQEALEFIVQVEDATNRKEELSLAIGRQTTAEEANKMKNEYLSRMSHELRTPLTAIIGYADLLSTTTLTEQQQRMDAMIARAGSHLLALINDVLEISRIEVGRESISLEPVGLFEIAKECQDLTRPEAEARRILVELDVASDLIMQADRQRLRQVILNLLSNAVKYAPEATQIKIIGSREGERIRVTVSDQGPGISEEKMPYLWQPFERVGAERSTVPGTGLGLALTKRLTELMGGAVGVAANKERGSDFYAEFAKGKKLVVNEEGEEETELPTIPGGLQKTIFYVEDNFANTELVSEMLSKWPEVQMVPIMQGRMAVELAKQHQPAAILLDVHLPDIEGSEVLRLLKADPRTVKIPVLVISADATEKQQILMKELGATAYLTKPFRTRDLLRELGDVLGVQE